MFVQLTDNQNVYYKCLYHYFILLKNQAANIQFLNAIKQVFTLNKYEF